MYWYLAGRTSQEAGSVPWNSSGSCSPSSPWTWPRSASPPTPAPASSTPPATASAAARPPAEPAAHQPACVGAPGRAPIPARVVEPGRGRLNLGVPLGLGSGLCWGAADFFGGVQSRHLPALTVAFWSQGAGALAIAAALAIEGTPPNATGFAWGLAAGVGGGCALTLFYR